MHSLEFQLLSLQIASLLEVITLKKKKKELQAKLKLLVISLRYIPYCSYVVIQNMP